MRLRQPTQHVTPFPQFLQAGVLRQRGGRGFGADVAGAEGVDADGGVRVCWGLWGGVEGAVGEGAGGVGAPFGGEGAAELVEGGFGGVVGGGRDALVGEMGSWLWALWQGRGAGGDADE